MARRSKKHRSKPLPWVTFPRCFLLTTGGLCLGMVVMIIQKQGHQASEWPSWAAPALTLFSLAGLILLAIGLLGSRSDAESVTETVGDAHEGCLFIMILAAPLYYLLKLFTRK